LYITELLFDLQLNSPRWYINNFSGREAANMIHLSYHHGEHYNSVRLREDSCQGPAMQVIIKVLVVIFVNDSVLLFLE